jgi:hypothetical protein
MNYAVSNHNHYCRGIIKEDVHGREHRFLPVHTQTHNVASVHILLVYY